MKPIWLFLFIIAALAETRSALAQRPMGIDVSMYQGSADQPPTNINWPEVKASGIVFTWAKATEGVTINDPDFVYNATNAVAAGVLIGAYHFARPELNLGTAGADQEAAHFWSVVSNYVTGGGVYLMPMLDYEVSPGSSYTKATSSQWVNEWCEDLVNDGASNGVAVTPVIYTDGSIATTWLDTSVTNWPLWKAASLNGQSPETGAPPTSPWTTWSVWQYGQGPISGIENDVDLDIFDGTPTQLNSLVISGTPVATTTTMAANNPANYGQTVVFTATVNPEPSSGEIQFYTNGVAWGDPLEPEDGEVEVFTSILPAGTYSISASFGGTIGYLASSTTNDLIEQINPAPLNITPDPLSKVYGTTLAVGSSSANFTAAGLANGDTVGTVTLTDSENGGAAAASVGTYPITPSLLMGGTFNPSNYDILYINGTLTVTLPSNTIPVSITSVALVGSGSVEMSFQGTPGYVYFIEAATNLAPPVNWVPLATNAADTNGLFSFTDATASNSACRFYRTRAQ